MTYLIMQMLFCLLIAAAIGTILGWLLRSWLGGDSGALKASLADLQTKLGLAEKGAKDAQAQLGQMGGKLSLAEKDVADARLQLSDWRLKFEGVEKEATGLRSSLLNAQGSMDTARADWDAKAAASARAADDLRTKLSAMSADHQRMLSMTETQSLGRINYAETAMKARLAKAEAETLDVRRLLDGAEGEIARLKAAATQNAASGSDVVLRFNRDDDDLKARVSNGERQIAALTDDIGRYRGRISELEAKLGASHAAPELGSTPATPTQTLGFAAVAATTAAAAVSAAAPKGEDDLKDIVGIGPVLERQLHAAGVKSFRDLARIDRKSVV